MRGFLSGIVTGAVVSGVGLVAAERYLPRVELTPPPPETGEVEVPAGSEFNAERPDAPPILPGTDRVPEGGAAPDVAAPQPAGDGLPDTAPLDRPTPVPMGDTALTAPDEAPPPVVVTSEGGDSPDLSGVSRPAAPSVDAAAAPEAPARAPETAVAPIVGAEMAPAPGAPSPDVATGGAVDRLAQSDVSQPAAPAVDAGIDADPSGAPPPPAVEPASPSDPSVEPEPVAPPSDIAALPQIGDTPPAPQGESAADAPPDVPDDAPESLRLPVPTIEDMAPGVTTNRLPRIGGEEPAAEVVPAADEGPALTRFAQPFEPGGEGPMMALVLVDVGEVRPDPGALAEFPLPLAVAIDPTLPGATDLMRSYRGAGLEVALLTPLPEGAAPADVEVAFQSFFAAVPEAVAVMDLPEAVLQDSRPRAAQVVDILAESGHGLVTYDRGLNMALQVASQAMVPAATVFRDIGGSDQDVERMKRFLDQAAFRAGQEGGVILKAEARPETLTALAEWSLGNRAATVQLVPLSAILSQ